MYKIAKAILSTIGGQFRKSEIAETKKQKRRKTLERFCSTLLRENVNAATLYEK
jgi:hypothetical protein